MQLRSFPLSLAVALFAVVSPCLAAGGPEPQEAVRLMKAGDAAAGWTFDNGREFPGATGGLTADPDGPPAGREGRAVGGSLKLVGDFTKGGNYVQAGRKVEPPVDVRELSMWVRNPDADTFTLRLNDATGQTHQIVLKTEAGPDWQRLVLPLERFYARRGQADAVTTVAKYESWGGAKDGNWHGPLTAVYVIVGRTGNAGPGATRTFWLSDVAVAAKPAPVAGADVNESVKLDEVLEGQHDWAFSQGGEVPGAKGSLTVAKDEPAAGQTALKLAGDFTGGGAYVAAIKDLKDLKDLDAKDVTAFRLRAKSNNAASVSVQVVDASGQTHQKKGVKVVADGQWHDLSLKPAEVAGGEHWGGANDGKWHGPPSRFVISVTSGSDPAKKQPVLYLADVRADVILPVYAQPAAFKADFDAEAKLPPGWTTAGGVSIDTKAANKGAGGSLALARSVDDAEKPCSAVGPAFPVVPGTWQVGLAHKSDLHSPDNSYNAVVRLECLDAGGNVVDRLAVAEVFGKHDWQPATQRVEVPKGSMSARFQVQLNKTYGTFWLDDLSAAYLAPPARRDDRISRLLFATARLGNLLFPDDPRRVDLTVEARKPLRDDQRAVSYVVRDYWGSEQAKPATVALGKPEKKGDRYGYAASVDLGGAGLEVGRYYELHASVGAADAGEPFRNHTSLAILPEAETKRYKPDDVPFTARNWDNRFPDYIRLADRLGIRVCGLWGGWSAKPPYKPDAPGLDLVKELGMGWLTNTPAATIERGQKEYDEAALRQGVRNLIEKYGAARPLYINLGNEPHGTGERVKANVEAYRALYEEIKKVDPSITVVATSVEPNEEYFKLGYGKWCDAFDFHIYETSNDVRRTMREYRALMKKYGVEKPLWSTELGLNSQGLTRHTVAVEVEKKFTSFFAEGGANCSWFGFLYPDAEGKIEGTSGQSHNVFDCRFSRYCPKLDAVAYYNMVNAIGVKKFVGEREYAGGVRAFLFRDRDGHALQVLWADGGRQDVGVPLPGVKGVRVIRVDGGRRTLDAAGRDVTLTVSGDPLLLLYDGGPAALPEALGTPLARLEGPPPTVSRRGATALTVAVGETPAADVGVVAPPFWAVEKPQPAAGAAGKAVVFSLTPPAGSSFHQGDFTVTINGQGGSRRGELYYRAAAAD